MVTQVLPKSTAQALPKSSLSLSPLSALLMANVTVPVRLGADQLVAQSVPGVWLPHAHPYLILPGFTRFLRSPACDIFNPLHHSVHQDMEQPLSSYYIAASHNTYLTGDQLLSQSRADMYARVLRDGCRCVEGACGIRAGCGIRLVIDPSLLWRLGSSEPEAGRVLVLSGRACWGHFNHAQPGCGASYLETEALDLGAPKAGQYVASSLARERRENPFEGPWKLFTALRNLLSAPGNQPDC